MPTATEATSSHLADQSNTISSDEPKIQLEGAFSEDNSIASPGPASPAPSLDTVDAAEAHRQVEGPGHIPADDDHTYSLPERQDTEADIGVLPRRGVSTPEFSPIVVNYRECGFIYRGLGRFPVPVSPYYGNFKEYQFWFPRFL